MQKLIESFDSDFQRCKELKKTLHFSSGKLQDLLAMCLYSSVLELCSSILSLAEQTEFSGIPPILRSMYEAQIDLTNSIGDEEYYKLLDSNHAAKRVNLLQNAHDSSSPAYIKSSGGVKNLRSYIKSYREDLKEFKNDGYSPINISKKFKISGRTEEYLTMYAELSGQGHNDVSALQSRHIRKKFDGALEVKIFSDRSESEKAKLIDLAQAVLLRATCEVHEFFDSKYLAEVDNMTDKHDNDRLQWSDNIVCE